MIYVHRTGRCSNSCRSRCSRQSFLPHPRLRLPRLINSLLLPADLAPADLHLHPRKRPVDRKIRDFPHCVPAPPGAVAPLKAALPIQNSRSRGRAPAPPHRRHRLATVGVARLVLCRRVRAGANGGVDRDDRLHLCTRLHPILHLQKPSDAAGSKIWPIIFEISSTFAPLRVSQTRKADSPAPAGMLSVPGNWCKVLF